MNFDYVKKVDNKIHDMYFYIDYKLLNDGNNIRNAKLVIRTDCIEGGCKLYNLVYNTNDEYLGYNWRHLNVDYKMNTTPDNRQTDQDMVIEYRRNGEVKQSEAVFHLSTDCSSLNPGLCSKYVLNYKTDSEYLGYFVRVFNLEYLIKNENNVNQMIINFDHKFAGEDEKSTSNLLVETDCSSFGECNLYKIVYNTDSELLGKNFKYFLWDYTAKTDSNNLSIIKQDIDYRKGDQMNNRQTRFLITTDCLIGGLFFIIISYILIVKNNFLNINFLDCETYQIQYTSDSEYLSKFVKKMDLNHTRSTVDNLNTVRTDVIYRLAGESSDRYYKVIQVNDISSDFYKIYKFVFDTNSEYIGNNTL